MLPIFEPGRGELDHQQFFERFKEICQKHIESNRAKAFAFIFYKFSDEDLQSILANDHAKETLNGIAGNDLTVFYLDTPSEKGLEFFNSTHAGRLNVFGEAIPPCVVFFKVEQGRTTEVILRHLERADLVNGLHELAETLKQYKERELRTRASVGEFLGTIKEMFRRFPRHP